MTAVAEKWAEVLGEIGVRYVFGIPSGPWVEYMEALRASDVKFVLVSNEASAGFMADVCGRITVSGGKSSPVAAAAALLEDLINACSSNA